MIPPSFDYHAPKSVGEALRTALVGYGLAGRVFHAPLIRATPGLALHAVVSSDAGGLTFRAARL